MDETVTQWFDGDPPCVGWWDTKRTAAVSERQYEVRLWWSGSDWRASPNSPPWLFFEDRQWRGLAHRPKGAVRRQIRPFTYEVTYA